MKSSDASKHHAKRPHPSHTHHIDHSAKKVFDVMRPGKAPALPTSRPVIIGHKAEAQKTQIAVSGIGENQVPVSAKPRIEIKPLHSLTPEPSAQQEVPALAVSDQSPVDPEDVPSGNPPGVSSVPALPTSPDMQTSEAETPVLPLPKTETVSPLGSESEPMPTATDEPAEAPAPTLGSLQSSTKLTQPESVTSAPEYSQSGPATTSKREADESSEPDQKPTAAPISPSASSNLPSKTPPKPEPVPPEFDQNDIQDIVVSHHTAERNWLAILLLLLMVLLAVVAIDILLDAEVISIPGMPHTDFL